jgi:threonine dehydrogenase-like Zn-dependent dehydrogenase
MRRSPVRALRITAPLAAAMVECPPPALPPDGVLVRARCTAISTGTEMRQYRDERVEQNPAGFPRANGYSMVGTVEAVGEGVSGLAVGQRVFVSQPHDELVAVPAAQVHLVPDGLADEQAVFTTLCEIGLHALRRGNPSFGENVAIIGQGIIGLATLAVARGWGLRTIALDLDARRREFARALGADLVVSPAEPDYEERIAAFCGPEGVDLVVEAASSWRAIRTAYRIVRRRGTISVVARHTDVPDFNPIQDGMMTKEVLFTTSYAHPITDAPPDLLRWTRPRDMRIVLEMLGKGRIDMRPAITHRITPDEIPAIYQRLHEGDTSIAGAVVDWTR